FRYLWKRTADSLAVTSAAGSIFITFAVILISTGTVCSFDVIYPTLPFELLTVPICIFVALNMFTHHYSVFTIPPGCGRSITVQNVSKASSMFNFTRAEIPMCRKCGQMRPERAHHDHCRICNRYVSLAVHFALSGINQCVGVYNERHFVMFMMYLCLSTTLYVLLGYQQFLNALGLSFQILWPYHVRVIAYLLTFILSCVLFFAVGIMLIVALWCVMKGETSVEVQDHEISGKVPLSRGVYLYDLGKIQNLNLFFNIGEGGYPIHTFHTVPFFAIH
ncbi:hypothetical protein K435DRAFT_902875, partial [Dendrothele bispora CBS 962.96]